MTKDKKKTTKIHLRKVKKKKIDSFHTNKTVFSLFYTISYDKITENKAINNIYFGILSCVAEPFYFNDHHVISVIWKNNLKIYYLFLSKNVVKQFNYNFLELKSVFVR